MNSKLKLFIASAITIGSIFRLEAQGYIVPNGVTYGGYDPTFGYLISVIHDPQGLNPLYGPTTQFWLNPVGEKQPTVYPNTFSFSELTDIGVRVFSVSSGTPITLSAINSQGWPELQLSSSYVFNAGVPFYVALYSGANFAPPYPPQPPYNYADPVFGWAELENVNGSIQLLNSALEYGGGGIYAGTQNIITVVPEPNSFGLFALGGLFVAWLHWRKSSPKVSPSEH